MQEQNFTSQDMMNPGSESFCPYCMSRVVPGESCPVCGLTQGAYTPSPHHLPPGTILSGRYLVGRVLGEGGFGITYIGCDLRLEMKVAIKEYFPVDRASRYAANSLSVITRTDSTSPRYNQGLKKFLYEARTMARMEKQPQIVMVRDFFEANNTAYIVMEYVEGTNFMQLVKQRGGRIQPEELFSLIEPLFPALAAVHEAGLIHRDISPDNLMLERGQIRLLDFGCARESARGTETLTLALKQGYAPIEQYQKKGQGPWTDVYALAATIYYCLTGRVPPQALDRLLEDELISPRELGVNLIPGQEKALLRGMAVQPRQRYQSVEAFYNGLYDPESEPVPPPCPVCAPAPRPVVTINPVITGEDEINDDHESTDDHENTDDYRNTDDHGIIDNYENTDGQENTDDRRNTENYGITQDHENAEEHRITQDIGMTGENEVVDASEPDLSLKGKLLHGLQDHRVLTGTVAGCAVLAALLILLFVHPWSTVSVDEKSKTEEVAEITDSEDEKSGEDVTTEEDETETTDSTRSDDATEGILEVVTSEEELLAALDDSAITEVVIADNIDNVSQTLTINKHVTIEATGALQSFMPILVRDGGKVTVQGTITASNGLIRTYNGGSISVKDGGAINAWILWLEEEDDLSLASGASLDLYGQTELSEAKEETCHYLALSEEELFAETTTVYTGDKLKEAVDSSDTVSITIAGDITLEESICFSVPVRIAEGGSLTAKETSGEDFSVCMGSDTADESVVLINHGTLSASVCVSGEGHIINYGTMEGEIFVVTEGNVINLENLTLYGGSTVKYAIMINLGTVTAIGGGMDPDCGFFDFRESDILNYGTWTLENSSGIDTYLNSNYRFINSGTLETGANTILDNNGWLENNGEIILAADASFDNSGIFCATNADSRLTGEGTIDGCGVILYVGSDTISLSQSVDSYSNRAVNLTEWEGKTEHVSDLAGLTAALRDESVEVIVIDADLTVPESLVIDKTVICDHELKVESFVTVDGGVLFSNDYLEISENAALTVTGDGSVVCYDDYCFAGDLVVEDGGRVNLGTYGQQHEFTGSVTLRDGGYLVIDWSADLTGVELTIDNGGTLFALGELRLSGGSRVTIAEGGGLHVVNDSFYLLADSTLINYGSFAVNDNHWMYTIELAGTVINYGKIEIYAGVQLPVSGSLTNYGTMWVAKDSNEGGIVVSGTLDNQGTIYLDSTEENDLTIPAEGQGSVTGNGVITLWN